MREAPHLVNKVAVVSDCCDADAIIIADHRRADAESASREANLQKFGLVGARRGFLLSGRCRMMGQMTRRRSTVSQGRVSEEEVVW